MALFALNRFDRNRFRALASAFMVSAVLAGCGGGGGGGTPAAGGGGMTPDPMTPDPITRTFTTGTPTAADRTGTGGNDVWTIAGNITGDSPTLNINGVINGADGNDRIELNEDAVVEGIAFSNTAPTAGSGLLHLQDIETITLDGGTVNAAIDASAAFPDDVGAGITFNLISGVAGNGDITGSSRNDTFIIAGNITGDSRALDINGAINGAGSTDEVRMVNGRSVRGDEVRLIAGGVVNSLDFRDSTPGDLNLQNVETITIDGGTVNDNIDGGPSVFEGDDGAPEAITFNLVSGTVNADIRGSDHDDVFIVSGNLGGETDTDPALDINGLIRGGNGDEDEVRLVAGGVVSAINFGSFTAGQLNLRDVETIRLDGGTVGNITGAAGDEQFFIMGDLISGDLNITGVIDGAGSVSGNTFTLASGGVVRDIAFSAENPAMGDVHLRNISNIFLRGGTVNNITGSTGSDRFFITGDLTSDDLNINGIIDGGDATDVFALDGGVVNDIAFTAGNPPRAMSICGTLRTLPFFAAAP